MSLYTVTSDYLEIQNRIEDGEDLEDLLQAAGQGFEAKAEDYAKVIKNIEAQENACADEEKRLKERRESLKKGRERLKDFLYRSMKATGKTKFKTALFGFNIQKNGGVAPLVIDVPVDKLPDELVKIERKADNTKIREWIEETGDTTYAHIAERGESLRIK